MINMHPDAKPTNVPMTLVSAAPPAAVSRLSVNPCDFSIAGRWTFA
jgi:hypothetical protein